MPVKLGHAKVQVVTRHPDGKIKAVRLDTLEHGSVWCPYNAIHDDSEVYDHENNSGELVVKSWFAEKKGWM